MTSDFLNPASILTTVQTALTALTLPESFDEDQPPAFSKVKIFDLQDIRKAFEELFLVDHRVAIIVLEAVNHAVQTAHRTATVPSLFGSALVTRTVDLTILFADRRYSDRQKALMGDSTTPGALFLAKLVVDHLSDLEGVNPSGDRCLCVPGTGQLLTLEDRSRDNLTGRIVYSQEFTIHTD